MYTIVYTKKATGDIPKLKAAKLDQKAKALIDIIRNNPYQTPPPYEKLVGDLQGAYSRRINNLPCRANISQQNLLLETIFFLYYLVIFFSQIYLLVDNLVKELYTKKAQKKNPRSTQIKLPALFVCGQLQPRTASVNLREFLSDIKPDTKRFVKHQTPKRRLKGAFSFV